MFELLFAILFFLVPCLIFSIYKILIKENILEVNIVNFLIINIFVFAYIGIIFLFFYLDPLRVANGVVDRNIIFMVWFYSTLAIIFIILGAFFSKKTLNYYVVENKINIDPIEGTLVQRLKSFVFIFLGFLALGLYIRVVPDIAIFNIFSFDSKSDIQSIRSNMGNSFEGSILLYNVFMKEILQFILFGFYAQWLSYKRKRDLYIVTILFFVCSFVALMATEKAPFVWLIIGMFLTNVIVKEKIIPIKSVFKIMIPVFSVLIIMYMFFMKSFSAVDAFNSVLSRAFTGSITPAYFYLDLFPEHHDYLYGTSFPNPKGVLPYEPIKLPVIVMNWVNPHLEQLGIVGSMPTVFWAEIYANFGAFFIAPFSFFVGFILKSLDFLILKLRNNAFWCGYYVWVVLYFKDLSVTSFSNYILNILFLIVTLIFFIIAMRNFKISYVR